MAVSTEKLYHRNAYETIFDAVILERRIYDGHPAVVLDRTYFYPASGGQLCDTGRLNDIPVTAVVEDGAAIVHVMEDDPPEDAVTGVIDWARRYDHMQQHTGQHILSAAFIKTIDAHTASFHMGEDASSIDITRAPGTPAEWEAVEGALAEVIGRNDPVRAYRVEPDEVEQLGLRKIPDRSGPLRIVEIGAFDRTACGGTHCASTLEVGLIRMLSRRPRRVHGGLYRVEFRCGRCAFADYARKLVLFHEITTALGVGESGIMPALTRLLEERKQAARALDELNGRFLEVEAARLYADAARIRGIPVIACVLPEKRHDDLKKLAQHLLALDRCVVLLGARTPKPALVFGRGDGLTLHAGHLLRDAARAVGAKGGGRENMAMGGAPDAATVERAIRWAEEEVNRRL